MPRVACFEIGSGILNEQYPIHKHCLGEMKGFHEFPVEFLISMPVTKVASYAGPTLR